MKKKIDSKYKKKVRRKGETKKKKGKYKTPKRKSGFLASLSVFQVSNEH